MSPIARDLDGVNQLQMNRLVIRHSGVDHRLEIHLVEWMTCLTTLMNRAALSGSHEVDELMNFAGERFRGRASAAGVELSVWDYRIRERRLLNMSWRQAVSLHSQIFDYMAGMIRAAGLSPEGLADLDEIELLPETLIQGSG